VKVTNLDTGKTVVVRINDRGPFKDDRVIDLSLGAAKQLGLIAIGTGRVILQILELGIQSK
jgi:rare lipoprotein A